MSALISEATGRNCMFFSLDYSLEVEYISCFVFLCATVNIPLANTSIRVECGTQRQALRVLKRGNKNIKYFIPLNGN